MAKEQKVEETEAAPADFARELSDLQSAIAKVRAEFGEILEAITKAKEAKEQAKRDYDSSLDAGDEQGMSMCLATIRESNSILQGLEADKGVFAEKVEHLRAAQQDLCKAARAQRPLAEKALQEAQENLRLADARIGQDRGLMIALNNLESFVRGNPEKSM